MSIKGFTLIELLVVISIIALLLSILMPALSKAKYIAQKTVDSVHVKQQVTMQLTFATANDGKFAQHWGGDPFCARDTIWALDEFGNPMERVWEDYHQSYVTDGKIFECPVMKVKGAIWADNKYLYPPGSSQDNCTGGWDAVLDADAASTWGEPVGSPSPYKLMGYGWFANYRFPQDTLENTRNAVPTMNPNIKGEDPWPDKQEECTARAVMASHIAASFDVDTVWWSFLHGGFGATSGGVAGQKNPKRFDNPVSYGDGHVTFHKAADIIPRGTTGDTWDSGIYYWY